MTEDLLRFPEAQEFLSDYPKAKWKLCIESVFIYGLYSIKRDFPNGLSIPELMQIAGHDKTANKSLMLSQAPVRPSSCKRLEEVQTGFKGFYKPRITEEENKRLKSSGSQTFISTNKSFNRSKDPIVEKIEDFSVSEKIREPRICSIENAKRIMKDSPGEALGKTKGKAFEPEKPFAFNFNVDYLPKTLSTDLYKREKNLLMSPKYF